MKHFLDASVLVEACLAQSPRFRASAALLERGCCTSAHALAEAYATLSGDKRLGIGPHEAAQMVADCAARLEVGVLPAKRMAALIASAPARGITGGSFFDAIHAETARQMKCAVVHTLNPSHFRHVAPDLVVEEV